MKVTQEDGMTWFESGDLKACISPNKGGWMVHSHWKRDGKNWVGGFGESKPIMHYQEAYMLAERFVNGFSVVEELGGYEDNKPLGVSDGKATV